MKQMYSKEEVIKQIAENSSKLYKHTISYSFDERSFGEIGLVNAELYLCIVSAQKEKYTEAEIRAIIEEWTHRDKIVYLEANYAGAEAYDFGLVAQFKLNTNPDDDEKVYVNAFMYAVEDNIAAGALIELPLLSSGRYKVYEL